MEGFKGMTWVSASALVMLEYKPGCWGDRGGIGPAFFLKIVFRQVGKYLLVAK